MVDPKLRRAAGAGDADQVAARLREQPDVVADWKPLMDACLHGHAEVARVLLDAGADPDGASPKPHRYRPLHRTVERRKSAPKHDGHDDTVRLLLDRGADVAARGASGMHTPLQLAAIGGEARFLEPLIQRMPALDIHHACALGDIDRVGDLLSSDPSSAAEPDVNGWPPMLYVAASRLHHADATAGERLLECARRLVGAGAEPNPAHMFHDEWPLPALFYAAGHADHPALVQFLLDRGADPNDGESMFHAADEGHRDCLELLLSHGGDLNDTGHAGGNTPLFWVVAWGSLRLVPWLLEHGADPNARSRPHDRTALHAAAARGCSDRILQLLLDRGADLSARDGEGNTPIDLAEGKGHVRVAGFLRERS